MTQQDAASEGLAGAGGSSFSWLTHMVVGPRPAACHRLLEWPWRELAQEVVPCLSVLLYRLAYEFEIRDSDFLGTFVIVEMVCTSCCFFKVLSEQNSTTVVFC